MLSPLPKLKGAWLQIKSQRLFCQAVHQSLAVYHDPTDFQPIPRHMARQSLISTSCLLGAALLLNGCTQALEAEVDRLRSSLNDLRSLQAEQSAQLSALQSDIRGMQGKQEEIEYASNKRIGSAVDSIRGEITNLKARVPPPAIVPGQILEDDEISVRSLPQEAGSRLAEALELLRSGEFLQAVPLLQSALDASEGREYAVLPLFWLGVSYDGVKDHRNALMAYGRILSQFPKSGRTPAAMLRQSGTLLRLGDKRTAVLTLKKLGADYPKTPEASQARQKIKELGE